MSQVLRRYLLMLAVSSCGFSLFSAEIETNAPTQPATGESDSIEPGQVDDPSARLEARRRALQAFEDQGIEARASADELLEILRDPEAPLSLRRTSLSVLARIGWDGEETTQALVSVLADPKEELGIRRSILLALTDRGRLTPVVVKAFSTLLVNPNEPDDFRQRLLFALSQSADPAEVEEALATLAGARNDVLQLRLAALRQLLTLTSVSPETVNTLTSLALDGGEPTEIRRASVDSLGSWGNRAQAGAPGLVQLIGDRETELALRLQAVGALVQMGNAATESAATTLYDLAKDTSQPLSLRQRLIPLLPSPERWPQRDPERWRQSLQQPDQLPEVRRLAIRSLTQSPLAAAEDLALAARLLNDPKEDLQVRLAAGDFLQDQGQATQPGWSSLTNLLAAPGEPPALRQLAANLLTRHCLALVDRPDEISRELLDERLLTLETTRLLLDQSLPGGTAKTEHLNAIARLQSVLQREHESRWWDRTRDWTRGHPFLALTLSLLSIIVGGSLVLCLAWALLARTAPGILWRVNSWGAKKAVGRLGVHHLLWASRWHHHRDVLNYGCRALLPAVTRWWTERQEQQGAIPFIDPPVDIQGERHSRLPWVQLLAQLGQPQAYVVVQGHRGAGKSSVVIETALRVCRESNTSSHRGGCLLPLSVDPSFVVPGDDVSLPQHWAQTLNAGIGPTGAVLPSDLAVLLSGGRILAVLDDWSEWSEPTSRVWGEMVSAHAGPRLPQLATITPSYSHLQAPTYQLELAPLDGQAVSSFLSEFVAGANGFTDEQSLSAQHYWADLSDGRPMPVEIVLEFARFIRRDPSAATHPDRPANLGMLIQRRLLTGLESILPDLDERQVFAHDLEALVWEALSQGSHKGTDNRVESLVKERGFKPEMFPRDSSLAILCRAGCRPGEPRNRAAGASLADYFAANHLLRRNGEDDEAWRSLFRSTPAPGEADLSGVGQALLDCSHSISTARRRTPSFPAWVSQELAQRLGVESEAQKQRRQQKETRQLIADILRPENPDRSEALESFAHLGSRAAVAVPELIQAFEDSHREVDVRQGALTALSLLGPLAAPALPSLLDTLNNRRELLIFRVKALELITASGPLNDAAIIAVTERFADTQEQEFFRLRAAQALLNSGADFSGVKPLLEKLLRNPESESPALAQMRKAIDRLSR